MNQLEDKLRTLSERGRPRGADEVLRRATTSSTPSRRVPLALVAAALVVVVLIGVLFVGQSDDAQQVQTDERSARPPAPVFPATTNTVLRFADGLDGEVVIDLDTSTVWRQRVDGQRAGDQPFRLVRVGDHVVFGWGEVYSAPIGGGPSKLLAEGGVFVPAGDDRTIWVMPWPYGSAGALQRVDADGVLIEEAAPFGSDAFLVRGVGDGLVFQVDASHVYRDRSGPTRTLGSAVGDAHGSRILSCDTPCTRLDVVDVVTGETSLIGTSDGPYAIAIDSARFAPDGGLVAVQIGPELRVIDLDTGDSTSFASAPTDATIFVWSEDGSQLFFANESYQLDESTIGRYDVATGRVDKRELPFGELLTGVAVDRDAANTLLALPDGERFVSRPARATGGR